MVTHLIELGEKQEEDNTVALYLARQAALLMLARLNPSLVLTMRAQCVELCRMPGTAVLLCLQVQAVLDWLDHDVADTSSLMP